MQNGAHVFRLKMMETTTHRGEAPWLRSWTGSIPPARRVAETIQGIAAIEIVVHANAVGVTLQAVNEAKHHPGADEHLWLKWS